MRAVLSEACGGLETLVFDSRAAQLFEWYTQGRLEPHISARFELKAAGQAIAHLAQRKALGKVIAEM
jgi:NADPH:quinone reductase-like Zn-dependent oxidoreductase